MNPLGAFLYIVTFGGLLAGWAYGFRHFGSINFGSIMSIVSSVGLFFGGYFAGSFAEFAFPGHGQWALAVTIVVTLVVALPKIRRRTIEN